MKLNRIICTIQNEWKQINPDVYNFWYYNIEFIVDYLTKNVKKLNIPTPNFNLLVIKPRDITIGFVDVHEYLKNLEVYVPTPKDELLSIVGSKNLKDRCEKVLTILERGYRIASEYYDIEIDKLLELHQKFREGGYKHEWLFIKKPIKEYGIYVFFNCYFTTIDFRLELEVYDIKKTQLLTKGVVFRTAPDRIHFGKDFNKGIEIDNDKMYLLDFLEKRAFEFDLDKLSKGEFNVIQLSEVRDYTEIIDRINWLK